MEGSIYNTGTKLSRLIPNQSSQDLELAFNTRSHQTYNIVYQDEAGAYTTVASNIAGTNGPSYHYLSGIPAAASLSDIKIQWAGGYVSVA